MPPTSAAEDVLFEHDGSLGLITLNRPDRGNALTPAMCRAIAARLELWARDGGVRAVALTAAGQGGFCAGTDRAAAQSPGDTTTQLQDVQDLAARIAGLPKPFVGLIGGEARGGAALAMFGSHRIVAETGGFSLPETGEGLVPAAGASFYLARLPGRLGLYLSLTGAHLSPADMTYAGLAHAFLPAVTLAPLLRDLRALPAGLGAAEGVSLAIGRYSEPPDVPALIRLGPEIGRFFASDTLTECLDEIARLGPVSAVARGLQAALAGKPAKALALTFHLLKAAEGLDLADCLRLEFRVASRLAADLWRGEAAKSEPNLASSAEIDAYFAPLEEDPPLG